MNEFHLIHGTSAALQAFPHIIEFATVKNTSIRLNGFRKTTCNNLRLFYILDGTFQWVIDQQEFILYPGDVAVVLPSQAFGSVNHTLEIGSYSCIQLAIRPQHNGEFTLGKWTSLSENETMSICRLLTLNSPVMILKFNEVGRILKSLQQELLNQELGHRARVNHLIDDLFILITRQLSRQSNTGRDFPKTFMKLEEALRDDLSHQWSVEEMAAFVGLGTTLFNERVKSYSGFSPLNYLIKIRISEAIKLLKKEKGSITDIALDTGFSSSQHFSTTFKKLTGYTPGEFRKKNSSND